MNLVWKLLRQHVSIAQFLGFLLANLAGMLIVMLGYQFYCDVNPVFSGEDSFMRQDFVILSKRIGAGGTLSGRDHSFSQEELQEMEQQGFVESLGTFEKAEYKIEATLGIQGKSLMNSELFLESVPDGFVDVPLSAWGYKPGDNEVPIILPRSYVTMYNFGFAQSHSLPRISEGFAGLIDVNIRAQGNGLRADFKGKVIGFSSRLNTILVPEAFLRWSNARFAPAEHSAPARVIVAPKNGTGEQLQRYIDDNNYEKEDNNEQLERMTYFLRLLVTLVVVVGLFISALSFYILMLSIYLLVQKNTEKLENLLLIGYAPSLTARPYQLLAVGLNVVVLLAAASLLWLLRRHYMPVLETISPETLFPSMAPGLLLGLALLVVVSVLNVLAVYRKVAAIWHSHE